MQPAEIRDLTAEQGSTFDQPLLILGSNNLPVDFSDIPTNPTPGNPAIPYSFRGQVRKKYSDTLPTLTFIITTPNIDGDPATDPQINIHLTAAALAAVPKGNYVYDVETYYLADPEDIDSEEIVHKLVKGVFVIDPEATKPVPN